MFGERIDGFRWLQGCPFPGLAKNPHCHTPKGTTGVPCTHGRGAKIRVEASHVCRSKWPFFQVFLDLIALELHATSVRNEVKKSRTRAFGFLGLVWPCVATPQDAFCSHGSWMLSIVHRLKFKACWSHLACLVGDSCLLVPYPTTRGLLGHGLIYLPRSAADLAAALYGQSNLNSLANSQQRQHGFSGCFNQVHELALMGPKF